MSHEADKVDLGAVEDSASSERVLVDFFGNNRPLENRPALHEAMERSVAKIEGYFGADLAAFIVLGVGADGHWSLGWRVSEEGVIGRRMLCGLAVEAIREDLLVDALLRDRGFIE